MITAAESQAKEVPGVLSFEATHWNMTSACVKHCWSALVFVEVPSIILTGKVDVSSSLGNDFKSLLFDRTKMFSFRSFGGSERRQRRTAEPVAPVAPRRVYVGILQASVRVTTLDECRRRLGQEMSL